MSGGYDDSYIGERCDVCDAVANRQPGGYCTALCTDNPTCPSRASYETPTVKHLICHPCWKMLPRTSYAAGYEPPPRKPVTDCRVPCPKTMDVALIAMLALARQGTPA